MWLIAADCHELLDALPVLVADEEKDGDIVKTDSVADDCADAARYGMKSMLAPGGTPKEQQLEDKFQAVRKALVKNPADVPLPGVDPAAKFGGRKL